MVNQWTRQILLVLSNLILMNLITKKMRTFIGARKQKSKDVLLYEISLSSTHKFDLNKPYFGEEEEIHSNEAMEQPTRWILAPLEISIITNFRPRKRWTKLSWKCWSFWYLDIFEFESSLKFHGDIIDKVTMFCSCSFSSSVF